LTFLSKNVNLTIAEFLQPLANEDPMKALVFCSLLLSGFVAHAAEPDQKPAEVVQMRTHYYPLHSGSGQISLPSCTKMVSLARGKWGVTVLVREMGTGDKAVTYVVSNSEDSNKLSVAESCNKS